MKRKKRTNTSNYLVPALGLAVLGLAMSSLSSSAEANKKSPNYNMFEHNYTLVKHELESIQSEYQEELDKLKEKYEPKIQKKESHVNIALCMLGEYKVKNEMQTESTYEQIEENCNYIKKNFAQ